MTIGFADGDPRSTMVAAPGIRSLDIVAWLGSVMMLLIYSQALLVPLFGESIDPDASGLVRALDIPAYVVGVFLLALKPGAALAGLIRQPFLIAIMAIVTASIAWSVSPDETVRRAAAVGLTTASAVALGARWRWPALAEILATTYAILVIGSLVAGLAFPSIGRMDTNFIGSWRGLWQEKNALGGAMGFGFLIFLATAVLRPERKWLWISMSGMAFALLLLSTSKTSLVALMLGLAAFGVVLLIRRGGAVAVAATYGAVLALIALAVGLLFASDVFLNLLGKDATLTGRTKIWSAIMRQIALRPWLGYGYGAVWTEDTNWGPLAWIVKQAGFRPYHAHNSWLEQWLGTGLVGLGAWTLYYLSTFGRAFYAVFTSKGALLALPFVVFYTVVTLTESVAVTYNDLRWTIFVALSIRLALPDREPLEPRPAPGQATRPLSGASGRQIASA